MVLRQERLLLARPRAHGTRSNYLTDRTGSCSVLCMEITKTFEVPGHSKFHHSTFRGTCTCGSCSTRIRDEHGNIDYGMVWSDLAGTYIPRDCEIAEQRRQS